MIFPSEDTSILDGEESRENESAITSLIEAIASEEAVLFIGSGPSTGIGYPDWGGLLTRVEGLLRNNSLPQKSKSDYLAYASELKKKILEQDGNLDRFHNEIYNMFNGKVPSDLHRYLVELPCQIVTTNYDLALSDALSYSNPGKSDLSFSVNKQSIQYLSSFLKSFNKSLKISKRICHLHGSVNSLDKIILCADDYKNAYDVTYSTTTDMNANQNKKIPKKSLWKKFLPFLDMETPKEEIESIISTEGNYDQKADWALHRKVLWSLIATRRIVFVGFGMRDPYLRNLLRRANADLWRWGEITHFNITSISKETKAEDLQLAKELKEEFGIQTVFYEKISNSHHFLTTLFKEIHEKCGTERVETFHPGQFSQPSKKVNEHDSVKAQLLEASGSANPTSPEWLKMINKKMELGAQNED